MRYSIVCPFCSTVRVQADTFPICLTVRVQADTCTHALSHPQIHNHVPNRACANPDVCQSLYQTPYPSRFCACEHKSSASAGTSRQNVVSMRFLQIRDKYFSNRVRQYLLDMSRLLYSRKCCVLDRQVSASWECTSRDNVRLEIKTWRFKANTQRELATWKEQGYHELLCRDAEPSKYACKKDGSG